MGRILDTTLLAGDGRSATNHLLLDPAGKVLVAVGTTVPVNGKAGYAVGCEFVKTNAANGQSTHWINRGTATSCQFRPHGPVPGYGVYMAGTTAAVTGNASQTISLNGGPVATDISFVEYGVSDDTDSILAQIAQAGSIGVTCSADPLSAHGFNWALLRSGCDPSYDIFAAGTATTVGGSTAEAITITGVLASDIALVCYSATDDTDTIAKAVCTANTLTVTMSADPGATHGLHYVILRPRGSFKPSHYIFAAGVYTTVGGAAAEAITVAGAKSTDVAIVNYNTTNDTDTILKSVLTTNTLTVTMSADPLTAHKLAYMILRAY